MLRAMMLASAFALGLAGAASATTIAFNSSSAFGNVSNCAGFSGGAGNACSIGSSGGGTNNVLDLSGSNNGTLTGNNVSFTGNTSLNNVTLGSLTWSDRNASGFDPTFGITYTLTINFTAPNLDAASEAFSLTVAQASGNATDTISGFTILAAALPGTIDLAGVIVSDLHFVTSGSGSFSNGIWSLPPCGGGTNTNCAATSTLLLEGDFTAAPAQVPEPMTLSLLGASLIGVAFSARRRRPGAR
jgi:hypothetical protein